MRSPFSRTLSPVARWGLAVLLLAVVGGVAALGFFPPQRPAASLDAHDEHAADAKTDGHDHEDHDGHPDEEPAAASHVHDEAAAVTLSPAARQNIGLKLAKVELKPYERTLSVPGVVIERPGWSVLEVTAPMTGVVSRIYPIQGETVRPGQPLFEIRLTHEDLLQLQTEFLRTVEELDVIGREVVRLEKAAADGAIAGKTLLERQYERQKQEALLRTQRQALLLHGLSAEQIDAIVADRSLLQSLTVRAPKHEGDAGPSAGNDILQVQQIKVVQGKYVAAGDTLATLVDHAELYIEGMAFEQDIAAVNRAAAAGWKVAAAFGSKSSGDADTQTGLRILYLDDKVDRDARTFHFYVALPNRLLRRDKTPDGRGFAYWQFKPGQRAQLRIPVERLTDRIVLPADAVVQEGAECYVFESNEDHFDRRAVHVEYRDQDSVVIANDGALRLGATVAASAAHLMQLSLKNKSGGGVDPHAGHNH